MCVCVVLSGWCCHACHQYNYHTHIKPRERERTHTRHTKEFYNKTIIARTNIWSLLQSQLLLPRFYLLTCLSYLQSVLPVSSASSSSPSSQPAAWEPPPPPDTKGNERSFVENSMPLGPGRCSLSLLSFLFWSFL